MPPKNTNESLVNWRPVWECCSILNIKFISNRFLKEGQSSPVPDILLFGNEEQQTPIIIEVCRYFCSINSRLKYEI